MRISYFKKTLCLFSSVFTFIRYTKLKVPFRSVITSTRHYYRHMKIVLYLPNFYQYFLVSPHSIISVPASLLLTTACEPYRSDEIYLLMQKFNHPFPSLHNPLQCNSANRFPFLMQGGQHNPRIIYKMSQLV